MYALYSLDQVVLQRVRDALPPDESGLATDSWPEFARAATRADCLIVAHRWLSRDAVSALHDVVLGFSPVPVILITTKDADNARFALRSGATRIVWLGEIHRECQALLRGVHTNLVLSRAAILLDRSPRLSKLLRAALTHVCRAERPVRGVGDLAALLHRDRRTLWRHWHRANGGTRSLRLEDFLGWVLVVHAAYLKSACRSWADVARGLGTHEHTLARTATRLVGITLSQLAESTREEVENGFLECAVLPLTGMANSPRTRLAIGGQPRADAWSRRTPRDGAGRRRPNRAFLLPPTA
jgi:hypothetical protein